MGPHFSCSHAGQSARIHGSRLRVPDSADAVRGLVRVVVLREKVRYMAPRVKDSQIYRPVRRTMSGIEEAQRTATYVRSVLGR